MGQVRIITCAVLAACLTSGCVLSPLRSDGGGSRKPISIPQAVEPISADSIVLRTSEFQVGNLKPFELLWAEMFFSGPQWDRDPVFVTCHASPNGAGYVIRLYLCRGSRLELIDNCTFGVGFLEERAVFIVGGHAFLLLSIDQGGSSSDWDRHLFWIGQVYGTEPRKIGIREVTISSPIKDLRQLIGPKQQSESGRVAIFSKGRNSLNFSFSIWNEGDPSNFPTGGAVEGDFKMVLGEDGIPARFTVDHWTLDAADRN
jgi:hypothetical protein